MSELFNHESGYSGKDVTDASRFKTKWVHWNALCDLYR